MPQSAGRIPMIRPSVSPRQFILASLIAHALFFWLRFTYFWLGDLVEDHHETFLARLIDEGTGALGGALLSWFVYRAWCASPLRSPHVAQRLPAYVFLGVVLAAANTSFMWGARRLLYPLAGLGTYDYGRMPLRYLMETPQQFIGLLTLLGVLALADEITARRQQATAQAEMARALVQSQLSTLRLQLQPHFLFNALNTISAQLHEDPLVADRLLGRLAELLRASLRTTDDARVPLSDELALLDAYAELMRARFGSRLNLSVDADPAALSLSIPPLLLQPMVENAIRHGGLDRTGTARVHVTVRYDHPVLHVRVQDDGPGVADGRDPLTTGTGLSTTARRLALLHGADAHVDAANDPAGGFAVSISLPAA